jgi:tetratricopeptide (TPR) repeat protein
MRRRCRCSPGCAASSACAPAPTCCTTGYCREQTGDVDGAAALYRDAIALDPDFMEAHVDLAGVLWRLEDFDGALAHAERAVQLAPRTCLRGPHPGHRPC